MCRPAVSLLVAAALGAPSAARAQVANAGALADGLPSSLALPVGGVAAAEEPSALGVNPAGVGFVHEACLQWFHEAGVAGPSAADGLYLAGAAGYLGGGLGVEWVRPGGTHGARYRKTTLALALTDQRTVSAAVGWSWFASPDAARDRLGGVDLGLTVRPWRHVSLGASALGLEGRLGGVRLPVRYALGAATRLAGDGLTVSADLLADDRARGDFHATAAAVGVGVETRLGLSLGAQVQVPLDALDRPSTLLTLGWNGPHGGVIAGAVTRPGSSGWLTGVRASSERYRGDRIGGEVPTIDLGGELEASRGLLGALSERPRWLALLERLERARDDPAVRGLVVRVGPLEVGRARVEELRARIAEIAARKPVLAWLAGGATKEYLLATAATTVAVQPGATVLFNGAGVETLYLRDALGSAGVAVDVVRVGAWKSAPEPFTRAEGSREAREAIEALLDDVHARDVETVARARSLPAARVEALFDEALFGAEQAKAAGLVDEVFWPDEIAAWASRRIGPRASLAPGHALEDERGAQRWGTLPAIGVVLLEGTIVGGPSRRALLGGRLAGAGAVTAALRRAAEDDDVRAIVLRVDSGGGDGLASDAIWREVTLARKRKPVVVSMGDLAASGGYLAAVAADAIVAEPSTLTGSVGVFAVKPDLSGLLEKLRVRREPHLRGEKALLASVEKPWTPAERAALQAQVDAFYVRFVERVAEGRRLSRDAVERVAQGRVWTGRQALERGLVDRLGTLQDAVSLARERARLPAGADVAVRIVAAPRTLPAIAGAAAEAVAGDGARTALELLGARIPGLRALATLAEIGPLVALPPAPAEDGP